MKAHHVGKGRGLHKSDVEKTKHRLGAHLHALIGAALAAGLVGQGQLKTCPRMDQGESETCHAHSASGSVWCAKEEAGQPLGFVPSPLLIASCTYSDVRNAQTPPGQPLDPLKDVGAELQDDATALAQWGVAPIQAPTPDGRYSDVPNDLPGVPFPEPDINQVRLAGADLIGGEYSINVDADAPRTVAACIDAKIPVWFGTNIGDTFQKLGPNDIGQPTPANDGDQGGHAMYISGYRTNAVGRLEFRVENSWGEGWADKGAVWVSEEFVMECWCLWPMDVATKQAVAA